VLTGAEERACWVPSPRESRAGEPTAIPVVPWSEPDGIADSTADERESAVTAPRGNGRTRAGRLGLGMFDEPDDMAAEPLDDEPQTPDPDDLWSLYLAGPSPLLEMQRAGPNSTVRSAGMWVESHRPEPVAPPAQRPLTARHKNGRSVRHRPWGAVPGRDDKLIRSLRMPEKVRRPGL